MPKGAESKRKVSSPTVAVDLARWGIGDWAGWVGLALLTVYFLTVSWRKWPDPLVDFGRELYTPWRLAEGAVLYRDVDSFYGPLSQYFNALVFAAFGPGLMTLVAVNLTIFAGILALLYRCIRRAWGTLAAFTASALFVSVFGFAQYTLNVGNYNYATPYSHETTHGLFVCLLLVGVLGRWVETPSIRGAFFAGFLFGLSLLLKPEIMLACGVVLAAALLLQSRRHGWPRRGMWLAMLGGATAPSFCFFVYFLFHLSPDAAFAATGSAWLNAVEGAHAGDVIQERFLGTDLPWVHALEHLKATLAALAVLGGVAGAAWASEKIASSRGRFVAGALLVAGAGSLSHFWLSWQDVGRCLLGLVLIYAAVKIAGLFRAREKIADWRGESMRVLLLVLAATLMARMALNGRIFQYGYYQAALAAVLIPAVLLGELGGWLRLKQGRAILVAGTFALLLPGVVFIARHSQQILRMKTELIGSGADRFYALPTERDPSGRLVKLSVDLLRQQPPGQTVVVLPEGIMINYLARRVSPVSAFAFYGAATAGGREAELVQKLRKSPPDWVVLVRRDLREYGIERYGDKSGAGQELLRWLAEDYERAAKVGGDPLDYRDQGAHVYMRKAAAR